MILVRRTYPTDSAEDLQQRLEDALARDASWHEVWTIYSEHTWFQRQVRSCALKAVRRLRGPVEWIDDIQQEAKIRIGLALRRDKTLGFNPASGPYAAWIFCLTRTACLKSLRQFRESKRMTALSMDLGKSELPQLAIEKRIELIEAIQRLEPRQRDLLLAYTDGVSVEELAQRYKVSTRTIYRLIHEAQRRVWRRLDV